MCHTNPLMLTGPLVAGGTRGTQTPSRAQCETNSAFVIAGTWKWVAVTSMYHGNLQISCAGFVILKSAHSYPVPLWGQSQHS